MADKIQGITVEIGGDTTGLSAALKDINKESAAISKELKEVDKLLKLDPGNTELLAQKQELLAKQADNAAKRVEAVGQAQKQVNDMVASGEIDKGSEEYRKFERQVASAEISLKQAEDAQEEFTDQKNAEKLDKLKAGFAAFGDVVKATVEAVAAVGAAVVAGVTAGAKAIADATTDAALYADDIATLSAKTGIATDTLQAYQYTAELVDVSLDTLTGSMSKNFSAMQKAANGNEAAAAAYDRLGVAVTDSEGKLRDQEDVYWELIDALGQVEDETERDALAMQIFGKSAKELNPLIETGSEALGQMMDKAYEAGAVLSEDTLNSLLGVSDAMEIMKSNADAVKNNFGALGATLMTEVYQGAANVEQAFGSMIAAVANGGEVTEEMKQQLTDAMVEMVENIAAAIPSLLEAIGSIFEAVLEAVAEALPGISAALTEYLPQLTGTILDMMPAIVEVGMQLFVALIDALPEIIDQIVGALPQIIDAIVNALIIAIPALIEAGVTLFTALIEDLPDIIVTIVDALPEIIVAIVDALLDAIPQLIQAGVTLLIALVEDLPHIIQVIVDALPQIIDAVVSGLLDALPQLVDAGVQLFVAIVQNLPEIIKGVVAAIPKIIKAMVDTFTNKDNLKKLADTGLSLVKGLWNGISDATSWIKEKIGGFASGIVDSIKDFFGIHSPSTVFRDEVGRMLALGVGEGFADEMKDVRRDMEDEIPTNFDMAVDAAWGAMAAGPTDILDLTIPFMVGAEKITTQVSRIQYNRQTGQARVLGVTTA